VQREELVWTVVREEADAANGMTLAFTVDGGAPETITFTGEPAEATATGTIPTATFPPGQIR
jgi:hypothetical protein